MKKRNWRTMAAAHLRTSSGSMTVEEGVILAVKTLRKKVLDSGQNKGVIAAPYDPIPLALSLGVVDVRAAALGFDGHVIQEGPRIVVEYDASIASRQRKRFTIAHEVGHLLLWNASGGVKRIAARRSTEKSEVEELCNKLAAEILAPKSEVLSLWKASDARLHNATKSDFIIELARHFDISVNFAAVRFKELCFPCGGVGLINTADRRFEWAHRIRGKDWLLCALLRALPARTETGTDSYSVDIAQGVQMIPFEWRSLSHNRYLIVSSA
jgi:hypothetical protein